MLLIPLEAPIDWCRELTVQIAVHHYVGHDAQHSEAGQLHFQGRLGHSPRLLRRWWMIALNFYLGPH